MDRKELYKMTSLTVIMVIIPVIVISYFFVFETLNLRKKTEIEKNIMIIKTAGLSIEHEIEENFEELLKMSQTSIFKQPDREQIQLILDAFHYGEEQHYFVLDPKGRLIASSNRHETIQMDSPVMNHFKKALQGKKTISDQYYNRITGKFVFTLLAPIFDQSQKVVGVIGTDIPVTHFKRYIDPVKIGETGYLSLIDSKGYYIYDRAIDNSKKLIPSNCYKDGIGQDLNVTERASLRSGERTVFTKIKIKSLGWYLVGFQPLSELNSPGKVLVKRNVIVFALLFLIIVILWRYKVLLNNRNMIIQRQHAEKLALVGELAAGMAHEIRNPLTTIKGFSNLLQKKKIYSEDKDILELLSQSVDHIEGIVRETLLLAKPQQMEVTNVELGALVTDIYNFMKTESLLKEINFDLKIEGTPLFIKGDELHIKQVLVNLIKNAIDATDKDGRITLILRKAGQDKVLIEINDTGSGMSPEIIQKLGTPFFTTKFKGTGLGLSVSHRMVEEHGGQLVIESKVGKGTSVKIYLPVVKVQGH